MIRETVMVEALVLTPRWSDLCHHAVTVARCPDGRIYVEYMTGPRLYEDLQSVPGLQSAYSPDTQTLINVSVPRLPPILGVDPAELHDAVARLDRARNSTKPDGYRYGSDGTVDAFGGSYFGPSYNGLDGLVRILRGVDRIATDAWHVVHGASSLSGPHRKNAYRYARDACRVAICCSNVYRLLQQTGIIKNTDSIICGTGDGYGLTGLRWLAGMATESITVPSSVVQAFVAGQELSALLAQQH